ncbi:MAG: NUDIX hydrolase [Dehalococcoidia bacterium]|nr:NUDIX hydrolase [Dehalococcoidia bacterium]
MVQQPQPINQETVFSGRIIEARVDTVLMPDGKQIIREVVQHPGAVAIIPIDREDNVLLVRQYRYPAGQSLLELPAGVIEEGESPDDTAQRELQEEIGYATRDLRALGGVYSSPGFCTEFLYLYIARDLVPSQLPADDDEDINVETIPMSRVDRLIRLGEIQDAKSVAGLLMARYLFK